MWRSVFEFFDDDKGYRGRSAGDSRRSVAGCIRVDGAVSLILSFFFFSFSLFLSRVFLPIFFFYDRAFIIIYSDGMFDGTAAPFPPQKTRESHARDKYSPEWRWRTRHIAVGGRVQKVRGTYENRRANSIFLYPVNRRRRINGFRAKFRRFRTLETATEN